MIPKRFRRSALLLALTSGLFISILVAGGVSPSTPSTATTPAPSAAQLVGSWQLSSNADNAASVHGHGALIGQGVFRDHALALNGGYVSFAADASLNIAGSLSLCLWLKPEQKPSETMRLLGKFQEEGNNREYGVFFGSDNRLWVFLSDNGTAEAGHTILCATANPIPVNGLWQHLAVTWDASAAENGLAVYLDGQRQATVVETKAPIAALLSGNTPLVLGTFDPDRASPGDSFRGAIAQLMLFRGALSAQEIASIHDMGRELSADGTTFAAQLAALGAMGAHSTPVASALTTQRPNGGGTVTANTAGNGLLAWWKLDETTGTTASDASGNGINGTLVNGPVWTTGKIGGALSFDGTDDYLSVPASATLDMGGKSFSVSAWFKTSVQQTDHIILEHSIWSAGDTYQLSVSGATSLRFTWPSYWNQYGAVADIAGVTYADNQWHHFVGVFDNTNKIAQTYYDGVLKITKSGISSGPSSGINALYIGDRGAGSGNRFAGGIDDVRIYNYALSAADVAALTAAGNSNSPVVDMIAYWRLDETSGTTAVNSVTNSYAGTLQNTASWTNGLFNGAMRLTGANDMMLVSPAVVLATNWTISAWFTAPLPNTATWHTLVRSQTGGDHVIITDSTLKLGMYDNQAGTTFRACTPAYNLGLLPAGWHHLTAVGSGTITTFYMDGAYVGVSDHKGGRDVYAVGNYQGGGQRFTDKIDDVRVYNRALTATEVMALVTMGTNQVSLPPAITAQPTNVTVTVGQTATFRVTATGNGPISYQWLKNAVNIPGATNATYTTPATVVGDNGALFNVVVANAAGSAASLSAALLANNGAAPIYYINFQPAGSAVPAGYQRDSGDLYDATRHYGWNVATDSRERYAQSDKRLDTFVFTTALATWNYDLSNGNYLVTFACGDPSYSEGPQRVSVEGQLVISNVTTQANQYLMVSNLPVRVSDGQLTIQIGGAAGYTMLNYLIIQTVAGTSNNVPVAQSQNVTTTANTARTIALVATDADNDVLSYGMSQPAHGSLGALVGTNVTYTPATNYYGTDLFTFWASDGKSTSAVATVNITVNAAPAITAQPTNVSVTAGQTATFSVTATGTAPL